MSEWISVKNELPQFGTDVLVYTVKGEVYRGRYVQGGCCQHWYLDESKLGASASQEQYVTHWMPLPEPPEILKQKGPSKMSEWISVDDRLPIEGSPLWLVLYNADDQAGIVLGKRYGGGWTDIERHYTYRTIEICYWCYVEQPELPKPEGPFIIDKSDSGNFIVRHKCIQYFSPYGGPPIFYDQENAERACSYLNLLWSQRP